ncbi:MAG: hypothetical protein R3330_13630, partial [Saprospiraceae bacterium]|nr:hypothetical protein [Saprospiraceae bacterium]
MASCPETITRTWTHTDSCGNTTTVQQVITVLDDTPPVFDPEPADVTVQCSADVPAMISLNWTDNCDGTGSASGTDVTDGNTCPEVITRSWTYTDACGNNTTVQQVITILDDTPPVFDPEPADVTVQCSADVPAMISLNWTDNCDGSGSVSGTDVSDGNTCPEVITRSWTYTDACGNNTTVQQVITVLDDTAPVFSPPPADVTVACTADIPVAPSLSWTDNCDGAGSVSPTDVSDGNTCPELITRTWSYTDACGNVSSVSQTITVHDLLAPTFNNAAPADVTVACTADIPVAPLMDWTDNCDGSGQASHTDMSDGNTCPEVITRTWSYVDGCGNMVADTQVITIHDTIAPALSAAPADMTLECVPAMTTLGWTDNCDGSGQVSGVDFPDVTPCPNTVTRRWIYADGCGNADTAFQTFTLNDTTAPVIICPAEITVNCPVDVPAPNPAAVSASDNCGNVTVVHVSD